MDRDSVFRTGSTILITGASSGIGRATALRFAKQQATLVLLARSRTSLQETADECLALGARAADVAPCDVNDAQALSAAIETAVRDHGQLDVVVHSAAVMAYGTVEELAPAVYRQVVDTSIHGTANLARAVLPVFRRQERGELIVVSSLLASIAAPMMGSYITAKWGQLGLIRVLQLETRDVKGIHISAVAPGGVDTPIYRQAANVIGRFGQPPPPTYSPDRVARTVVARLRRPRRLRQSGVLNPLVIAGFRLTPALFDLLVGPLLRTFGISKDTVAPTDGNVFRSVTVSAEPIATRASAASGSAGRRP